jgi:hypothetical protein
MNFIRNVIRCSALLQLFGCMSFNKKKLIYKIYEEYFILCNYDSFRDIIKFISPDFDDMSSIDKIKINDHFMLLGLITTKYK